ncbi:MAG: hypothetical protein R3A52_09415 [Polyangiales bacterium]
MGEHQGAVALREAPEELVSEGGALGVEPRRGGLGVGQRSVEAAARQRHPPRVAVLVDGHPSQERLERFGVIGAG